MTSSAKPRAVLEEEPAKLGDEPGASERQVSDISEPPSPPPPMPCEPSDESDEPESVLVKISSGEPGAMNELMKRYGGLIWWMARRWNRRQADAEDAVQEIMMDVWKSAASFDRSLGREEVYVSMIARRRLVNRHRSAKRQRELGCIELIDSKYVQPAASQAEISEECRKAMKMLEDLGGDQDEVLRLAYAEGYTFKRISRQLDLPVATVVSRVQRGLQRLQHLLKEAQEPRDNNADV